MLILLYTETIYFAFFLLKKIKCVISKGGSLYKNRGFEPKKFFNNRGLFQVFGYNVVNNRIGVIMSDVIRIESDVKCIASESLEKAIADEMDEIDEEEKEAKLKERLKG